MIKNEKIINIRRPIEEVFAYVSDPQNGPQWQPELLEVRRITKGPLGIGTQFTSARKIMGQKMETSVELTAYEPNSKVALKSTSGAVLPFEQLSLFESTAEGTKLTTTIELHPGSDMAQAAPMLAESLRQEMATDFDGLKKLLESRIPAA